MKGFIIAIFSPLLQLNVFLSTIGGFVAGGIIGGSVGAVFGEPSFNYVTALIFAALAFANSAIVSGAGLAIDRMRELMEEQVDLTKRQQSTQRASQILSSIPGAMPSAPASRSPVSSRMQAVTASAAPAAAETRVCPQCGARYDINLTVCDKCGTPYPKF